MIRYFCPNCWSDFLEDLRNCPACGLDIEAFWDSRDWVDKLIVALGHPEQNVPIHAAWILGERRETRAIQALIALVRRAPDVYTAVAAVRALGRIAAPEAMDFISTLDTHPAGMVREEAALALELFRAQAKSPPEGGKR